MKGNSFPWYLSLVKEGQAERKIKKILEEITCVWIVYSVQCNWMYSVFDADVQMHGSSFFHEISCFIFGKCNEFCIKTPHN